jgi:hypothetical protein
VLFEHTYVARTLISRKQNVKSLAYVHRIAPSNIWIPASASRNQISETLHSHYLEVVTTVLDSSGSWRANLCGRPVSCLNISIDCQVVLLFQDTFQQSFAVTNHKHITFSSREIRVLCLDLIRAVVYCVYVAGVEISRIQLLVSNYV